MKNVLVNEQKEFRDITDFVPEEKNAIIGEALIGVKSLSEILSKYCITERMFYLWMAEYIRR